MIAALPMYERPETRGAHDRFWTSIRDRIGSHCPQALTRGGDLWKIWTSPDLVLAQTCGMPFRTRLISQVALVGTPDYGLEDCPPGHYRSIVVTRPDETRPVSALTLAVNEGMSQSGWAAAAAWLDARRMTPDAVIVTGGHAASASAVADGVADIAFLDALTWRNLTRWDPVATRLTVIDRTPPTPGLPYITAKDRDPAPVRTAVAKAIESLAQEDRDLLGLRGLIDIPAAAYIAIPNPPPLPAGAMHLP